MSTKPSSSLILNSHIRNLFWYAVPTLVTRGAVLFLLPLYTRVLNPGEYGLVSIATSISGAISLGLMLNVENIYLRYCFAGYAAKGKMTRSELGTVVRIHLFLVIVVLPLATFPILHLLRVVAPELPKSFAILSLLSVAISSLAGPTFALLRSQQKAGRLAFYQVSAFALELSTVFICLFVLKKGAISLLIGSVIGQLIFLPAAVPELLKGIYQPSTREALFQLAKSFFAVGPEAVAIWGFSAIDRLVLNFIKGSEATGLYSVAFQMGSAIVAVAIVANKQWQVFIYQMVAGKQKEENVQQLFQRSIQLFLALSALLVLIAEPLSQFFLGEKFRQAVMLLPPIALAAYLRIPQYFLANAFWALHHRRKIIFYNTAAIFVMVLSHLLLIPRYGARGAAFANILGLGVYLLAIYIEKITFLMLSLRTLALSLILPVIVFANVCDSTPWIKMFIGVGLTIQFILLTRSYFEALNNFEKGQD